MLFLEIQVNHQSPILGGGDCVEFLGASIVGARVGKAWLSLNGRRRCSTEDMELLEWISMPVQIEDCIVITPRRSGHASVPLSVARVSVGAATVATTLEKELSKLKTELKARSEVKSVPLITTDDQSPLFEIKHTNALPIIVGCNQEDQIQIVLSMREANGDALVEVDSLSVVEGGYTKGKRWMEAWLGADESLLIRVQLKGPTN